MSALRKFWLLQLPDAVLTAFVLYALHRWAGISTGLAVGLFALWTLAHIAYYPFVKKAYGSAPSEHVGPERMVGAQGVATQELNPIGYVRVGSELWGAELGPGVGPIAKGESVRVQAVRDLTLIVQSKEPAKSC
jgi:membrane protein implicated in regulation of membrane protease activity